MQNLPSLIAQDEEDVENSKRRRRDREEVDRGDLRRVALQKRTPGLRGRLSMANLYFDTVA